VSAQAGNTLCRTDQNTLENQLDHSWRSLRLCEQKHATLLYRYANVTFQLTLVMWLFRR
jgi:hypothetical protein